MKGVDNKFELAVSQTSENAGANWLVCSRRSGGIGEP
jgi:hypothetical protein